MKSVSPFIEIMGQRLQLLPQRAVWWPQQRALLVADVHLGKGAEFRRRGMAVPAGSSAADFQRLATLIQRYRVAELWVLGDLFHKQPDAELSAEFAIWRRQLRLSRLLLIQGNHDTAVQIHADWQLEIVSELEVEGIRLCHMPSGDAGHAEIAGHLHPTCRIRAGRADSLRAPAFWLRGTCLVMPAFGSFTGGYDIDPQPCERVFAVGPQSVLEISVKQRSRTP